LPQDLALRQHAAFFHDLARNGLDAETDGFFVNVESDIVKAVHRVLQVRFLSWRFLSQSQHRSRFENPSSFHLCIHTDGTFTDFHPSKTLGNVPSFPGFLITSRLPTNRELARVAPQPKTPHRQW
jgi:hypothetical protein